MHTFVADADEDGETYWQTPTRMRKSSTDYRKANRLGVRLVGLVTRDDREDGERVGFIIE
jgi:hypothetical protein